MVNNELVCECWFIRIKMSKFQSLFEMIYRYNIGMVR